MIIDRFEGEIAVIEIDENEFIRVPKKILPPSAEEGNVIQIIIDLEGTRARAAVIADLEADLFEE